MNKFCRIFETVKHGQILVQLLRMESGEPLIGWSITTGDYHVDGIDVVYENSDNGWFQAESAFQQFDTEMAYRVAEKILKINEKENNEFCKTF